VAARDLARALRGVHAIALDTSAILAAGDASDLRRSCSEWLLERISSGRLQATISAVTASELMVRPLLAEQIDDALALQALLTTYPHLHIHAFTATTAAIVAGVRARTRLKTPDACVVAAALETGAAAIVHGDRDLARAAGQYPDLRFVDLTELCA